MSSSIAQVHTVGTYSISETDTKRDIDFRRFHVQKRGRRSAYVVTMQTRSGRRMQCSCPAGCNQKACKHLDMVRNIYC